MNLAAKAIFRIGIPIVVDAIVSAIESADLVKYRDEAINGLRHLADKTDTKIDNYAVETLAPVMMDFSNIKVVSETLIPQARNIILASESEYDDKILLPILDALEAEVNEVIGA